MAVIPVAILLLSSCQAAPKEISEVQGSVDVMSQLTVSMVTEVLDGQLLDIRSSSRAERQLLRLGNTALKSGKKQAEKAKKALSKKALKQMIWRKAAPETLQRTPEDEQNNVTVADVWTLEGEHLPNYMVRAGLLLQVEEYKDDMTDDILSGFGQAEARAASGDRGNAECRAAAGGTRCGSSGAKGG